MRRLAYVLLILSSCTTEPESDGLPDLTATPAKLAILGDIGVHVSAVPADGTPNTRRFSVYLTHNRGVYCPQIEATTTMSIDGHELAIVERGSYSRYRPLDGRDWACYAPRFEGNVPAELTGPATLELADSSLALTFDITLR